MTYLELVNAVLRRLREDEVLNVSDTGYSKLIGDFVNEAKQEVENAWNWTHLRSTIQVNTVADTFRYTLTGAGNRGRILHVFNDSQDYEMRLAPSKWMTQQYNSDGPQKASPIYYDFNGNTSGDPNVDVFPIPDAVYVLNFDMVVPQADFTANADTLTVPSQPVVLGAYAKAISERGEDGGQSYGEALNSAAIALSDAIAIDAQKVPSELVWEAF